MVRVIRVGSLLLGLTPAKEKLGFEKLGFAKIRALKIRAEFGVV